MNIAEAIIISLAALQIAVDLVIIFLVLGSILVLWNKHRETQGGHGIKKGLIDKSW